MADWRGVEYYELTPRSPNEMAAQDDSRTLRTLDFPGQGDPPGVPYAVRESIRREWLGYATIKTVFGTGQRYISRTTPHYLPAPDGAGLQYQFAQSLVHSETVDCASSDTSPLHAMGDRTANPERWRATWEYRAVPWDVKEDADVHGEAGTPLSGLPDEGDCLRRGWKFTRNITKRRIGGGRIIPLRHGALQLGRLSGLVGKTVHSQEPFPLQETLETLFYLWTCPLDKYPDSTVRLTLNCVNDEAFDNHAAWTLLLLSADENVRRDPFGQRTMEVCYKMLYAPRANPHLVGALANPLGHNAVMYPSSPEGPTYYIASSDGSGLGNKVPFKPKPFSALFRPDQS